jgi:hypothetical protein
MGCTRWQLLWRVKLPLAIPEMMLGLNQTIMFGISMLVITALVGTSGLGQQVYIGLGDGDFGVGMTAGIGMAIIAIIADRLTPPGATNARSTWASPRSFRLKLEAPREAKCARDLAVSPRFAKSNVSGCSRNALVNRHRHHDCSAVPAQRPAHGRAPMPAARRRPNAPRTASSAQPPAPARPVADLVHLDTGGRRQSPDRPQRSRNHISHPCSVTPF